VSVAALSKNLADALGDRGINVNTVHPGATWTEAMQDRVDALEGADARDAHVAGLARRVSVGRIVDASEVAAVITFLASPWSVAINGASIDCGGGTRGSIYY
jgi:NAD(P)-dependent dehydrogenase (short-subunit alcohol dehydrogenase family)